MKKSVDNATGNTEQDGMEAILAEWAANRKKRLDNQGGNSGVASDSDATHEEQAARAEMRSDTVPTHT